MRIKFSESLVFMILGITSLTLLLNTHNSWIELINNNKAQIDNVSRAQSHIMNAHLWIEESISGDSSINIKNDVWLNIDNTELLLKQLLNGSINNQELTLPTILSTEFRSDIEQILLYLTKFKSIAQERLDNISISKVGSKRDQNFDTIYNEIILSIRNINNKLLHNFNTGIHNEKARYYLISSLWFVIIIFSTLKMEKLRKRQRLFSSEMKKQVKERTRELNSISILSPDGFVLVNADNNIAYTNPAFLNMTGFKNGQFIGESAEIFSDAMSLLYDSEHIKYINFLLNDDCEYVIHLLRPHCRVINCNQRTMRGVTGKNEGQVLYFRDVTHETEVDNMKSEFLSTAAHELRTPLASIYGFSELLLARNYDKKMSDEMIKTIHRQSLNLKHLLDELLDLSRIEARAGKDFYMVSNSLKDIVQESCTEIEGAFKGRKVDIQPLVDWRILSFDKDKMRQVFRNLLSNGFKYSPDNENVQLKTSEREKNGNKQFGISIIDKGIGMTPQQLSRLGERFYRADDSGSTPGTGLGVSLVKEIVSIHDGETEFISTKGKGMVVTVWLPMTKNQSSEE